MIVITTGSLKLNRAKKGVGISSVLWSDIQWSQVLVQQVVGEVVFTFSWLGWIVECVCPHTPPPPPWALERPLRRVGWLEGCVLFLSGGSKW